MTSTGPMDAGTILAGVRRLPVSAESDGEFELTARYWNGRVRFGVDEVAVDLVVDDGRIVDALDAAGDAPDTPGVFGFTGPAELWSRLLAPVPEPLHNDLVPTQAQGMRRTGNREAYWQYYPAMRRLIDLLRDELAKGAVS